MEKTKECQKKKEDINILSALYIRVSTEEQAKEGLSLAFQEKKLKQFCQLKDFRVYDIYNDAGKSGGKIEGRKEFQRMFKDAKEKKFKNIVFLKIDRFSRSSRDLILSFDELNIYGINIFSLNEGLDTTTPIGKAVLSILGVLASLERELAKERTENVLSYKVSKGQVINRPPFGYLIKNKELIVNNSQSNVVKQIYIDKLKKLSNKTIARKYNLSNVQVSRILKNVTYVGKIMFKGKVYKGNHKPIIDIDDFIKVNS